MKIFSRPPRPWNAGMTTTQAVDAIAEHPGDVVLSDGTRIVVRDWGGMYDCTVMPTYAVGWSTGGLERSREAAIKAAKQRYATWAAGFMSGLLSNHPDRYELARQLAAAIRECGTEER